MTGRLGVALALTAVALLPAAASGHGGLVLSASGTATVDGVIDPAEWGTARPVDFAAQLPVADGGGAVPARVLVMNDEANLYLAVRVERIGSSSVNAFFRFDRDHDGILENGDDELSVFARDGFAAFRDAYRWECSAGAPGTCGEDDTLQAFGSPPPGTTDGSAAAILGGGAASIELSHPLDSADNAHDFSLAPGGLIGFEHAIDLFTSSPCAGLGCAGRSATVRAEVALSPLAQLSVAHVSAPRRVRAGTTATYTLRISNDGGGTAVDVRLVDELPRGARAIAATTTHGLCTRARETVACRLGAISSFGRATVRVRARLTRVGRSVNRVTVLTASHDEIGANNHSRATTVVRR